MHEHLTSFFSLDHLAHHVKGKPTAKRITLENKSRVEVLAASQTAVRGTRVQKIRCDEVDLFDRETWDAAQLTTRSMNCVGPWGTTIRGSVEALSTMHRPYGLMWELVGARLFGVPAEMQSKRTHPGSRAPRRIFRWGIVDVLERCGHEHTCNTCSLHKDCRGVAKSDAHAGGHITIADAQSMISRVDWATWSAEMLCNRPRRTDSVYPEFDPEVHVVRTPPEVELRNAAAQAADVQTRLIAGMDFGIRAECVILVASVSPDNIVRVEWEHAAKGRRLQQHIDTLTEYLSSRTSDAALDFLAIDPAGFSRSDQTGESNAALLRDAGLKLRGRRSTIELGIQLIRTRLAPASWSSAGSTGVPPVSPSFDSSGTGVPPASSSPLLTLHSSPRTSLPTLFISAACPRLIECLQRYHYPENRPDATEPDKSGGFDHACDALRYLILNLDKPTRLSATRF